MRTRSGRGCGGLSHVLGQRGGGFGGLCVPLLAVRGMHCKHLAEACAFTLTPGSPFKCSESTVAHGRHPTAGGSGGGAEYLMV